MKHIILSLPVLLFILFACSETEDPPDYNFGYDYFVVLNDSLPAIVQDSLRVRLAYTGCSGGHEFQLMEYFSETDEVEIWLKKIAPDEACDMAIQEDRTFALSSEVLGASVKVLLCPDDTSVTL